MRRRTIAAAAAAAVATALAVAAPLSASAHIQVAPNQAPPGGYALLTFRVPTESATAGTVRFEIDLPTKTPFTSVSYQPVAGWSTEVTTSTLPKPVKIAGATVTTAPTRIVWTADPGVRIEPGQFQQFSVTAGAVPETGKLLMPAVQTYSDGSVVHWNQPTPASGEEPEHPAPTLYIDDAPPGADAPSLVTSTPAPAADGSTVDPAAIGLGIGGVVLGAVGVVIGVLALTRRPRPTRSAADGDGGTA